MRRSHLLLAAALVATAACGKKPAPEPPAPAPAPAPAPTPAPTPAPAPAPAAAPVDNSGEITRRVLADLTAVINFDFDKSDIRNDDRAKLDMKAAIMAANMGAAVRIAGNADERGSDEYNLALGMRRATSAKRYLESKGVDGGRMEVVSFGEERPLDPGHDEGAWAKNRRDDFEVTRGGERLVAPR